jgi:hypothetical protein
MNIYHYNAQIDNKDGEFIDGIIESDTKIINRKMYEYIQRELISQINKKNKYECDKIILHSLSYLHNV